MNIYERIISHENLLWAWNKLKLYYNSEADFVPDQKEFTNFDMFYASEIDNLHNQLLKQIYDTGYMQFMPLPKKMDEEKNAQYRQYFYVPIKDQIVWLAIINIIGPRLDIQMPYWSFGNRLYFPVWYEKNENKKMLKCGKYRPSSKNIYRIWSQSWPLFRKAIRITTKKMVNSKDFDDDDEIISNNNDYPDAYKIQYWKPTYWAKTNTEVFWAGLDFKKFYPRVPHKLIIDNIKRYSFERTLFGEEDGQDATIQLVEKMLNFKISPFDSNYCNDDKEGFENGKVHNGIPTGLLVGGFLANIAMLSVDKKIEELLKTNKAIAHFRYVDDHIILAGSFEDLVKWIEIYQSILENEGFNNIINKKKTEPEALKKYFDDTTCDPKNLENTKVECLLDPKFPTPLMTLTLKRMSDMNHKNFILMDDEEKMTFKDELIHLLLTELPEGEMKSTTRVSWASSMLNKVIPTIRFKTDEIYRLAKEAQRILYNRNCLIGKEDDKEKKEEIKKSDEYEELSQKLLTANEILKNEKDSIEKSENILFKQIFEIYLRAINENYEKPVVWGRAITYCRNTGFDGFLLLLNKLKKYFIDKKINKQGYEYLEAVLYAKMSSEIIAAINLNYSENVQYKNKKRSEKFLRDAFTLKLKIPITENYLLYNQFKSFEVSLQIAKLLINDSSETMPSIYFNSENGFLNTYILERIYDCHYKIYGEKSPCYEKIALMNIKDNYYETKMYFLPFSEMIFNEEEQIRAIEKNNNENSIEEMNMLELLCKINLSNNEILQSERFSLEITKKIAEAFLEKHIVSSFEELVLISKENQKIFNPSNIIFVIQKGFKSLLEMKNFNKLGEMIKVKLETKLNKNDIRYLPTANNIGIDLIKERYFIGIIMVKLLMKDARFDNAINIYSENDKTLYALTKKMNMYPISSWTRAIVQGCLSIRDYETKKAEEIFILQENVRDDTKKDPIKIESIIKLIEYIDIAIEKLESYCVVNNSTCDSAKQLVPICLEQFNRSFNPYSEEE